MGLTEEIIHQNLKLFLDPEGHAFKGAKPLYASGMFRERYEEIKNGKL